MMNDDEVETSEPHDHVGLGDASLPDQFRSDRSGTPSRNKLYIFVHQTLLPRNHVMSRSLMAERCWRGREVRIGAHNSTGRPCSQQASQSPIPNHMDCSHVVQHKTTLPLRRWRTPPCFTYVRRISGVRLVLATVDCERIPLQQDPSSTLGVTNGFFTSIFWANVIAL